MAILMNTFPSCLGSVLCFLPWTASATLVTTVADEDDGSLGGGTGISLREAVKYSPSGDIITFSSGLSGATIRLAKGPIAVNQSLTIDGSALPARLTLSADRTGNGKTADDTYAILLTGGNLVLDTLILTGANCGESSGCVTIKPSGNYSLMLDHCTITGNAGYHASALYCFEYKDLATRSITISNSTIFENSVVKGSSVITVGYCDLTVRNSTICQNSAGAVAYRAGRNSGTLSISYSTLCNNGSNGYGAGGLYVDTDYYPGTIYVNNSLCVGNNLANISLSSPGITLSGTNNILTGDALLAPLADYGGPTLTMPPLPGSPAIGAGAPDGTASDQRGFPRDTDAPDIGAAEFLSAPKLLRFWSADFDGDGSPFGIEQAIGTQAGVADPGDNRNLAAPTFDAANHPVLSFGLASSLIPGTRLILKRSLRLAPLIFTEIFSTDRVTDSAASGISFSRSADRVTVTDLNPPHDGAFYRLEARLEP